MKARFVQGFPLTGSWDQLVNDLEYSSACLADLTGSSSITETHQIDGYRVAIAATVQQMYFHVTERKFWGEVSNVEEPLPTTSSITGVDDIQDGMEFGHYSSIASHHLHSYISMSEDCVWIQDPEFRITSVAGQKAADLQNKYAVIGRRWWDLLTLNVSDACWIDFRKKLLAHEPFWGFEIHLQDAQGQVRFFHLAGTPLHSEGGDFLGYRGICREETSQKAVQSKFVQSNDIDELTGLFNRKAILNYISDARKTCVIKKSASAVLIIDLDNFKDINDAYGHDLGDELLVQVASRLKSGVRGEDFVARLGGDEFLILFKSVGESYQQAVEQADKLARKIKAIVDTNFILSIGTHRCTVSMGIVVFTNLEESSSEILKRADVAMYQAKSEGRNLIKFFDQTMQLRVNARTKLEQELAVAIIGKQLLLFYQPIVDTLNKVVGYEALVRWQHPERGLVPPSEFIAIAEHCGLIIPLGEWVLNVACDRLASWARNPDKKHLTIAVNLSARQLIKSDIVNTVQEILARSQAPANRLKFEITESLLLHDIEDIIFKVRLLIKLGITFSLDDFGTGYSSLSYLKRIPLSQLKIDRSFVKDILTDARDKAIAETILQLARGLGLTVIAEGVETYAQRTALQMMGCPLFQGYLFGHPLPIQDDDD